MGQNVLRNRVRWNSPSNQAPGKIKTGARKTARIKENDFRVETNKVWERQRNLDRGIWTSKIMVAVIKQRWKVELKTSRISEILADINISHQKAHRDYAKASPEKQKEFVEVLKKNSREKEWG